MPLAFALASEPVGAQIGFESLLNDVTDVNFFFSCWSTRSGVVADNKNCPSSTGYGIEVSFDVGNVPLGGAKTVTAGKWKDTVRKITEGDGKVEIVTESVWVEGKTTSQRYMTLEFALGYSQFSGFRSPDPSFELRGSVRELPAVAIYGSLHDDSLSKRLGLFFGAKSGLIQLHNVQLYDPRPDDTLAIYSASATTFQVGAAIGLVFSVSDRLHLFLEQSYHFRKFPNVQWSHGTLNTVRPAFPRELDFTGPATSFGLQLTLRDAK